MSWITKEWADIGPQLKYDIYKGAVVASGSAIIVFSAIFMKTLRSIPAPLFYGVLLTISCACFYFLVSRFARKGHAEVIPVPAIPVGEQLVTTAASLIDANVIDEFYLTSNNAMLTDCEILIRTEIQKHPIADRDRVTIRLMAAMMLSYIFESIWNDIFRSQIEALHELNRHNLKRDALRQYYDTATVAYPYAFLNYSYDEWIGWLRSWMLIIEQGDMVSLTVRGGAFLKWLLECRRTAADKTM